MKRIILITAVILTGITSTMQAQFAVLDPVNLVENMITALETGSTTANVIETFNQVKKVYEQGKEYYDKLKSVHNVIKDAKKVKDAVLLVGEISDIYVNSFGKMLSDPHFRQEELTAISNGYTILLQESADMLKEIKDVVNENNELSMTDAERINIINYVYDRLKNHRNLVSYYTRKNISISYLRAKKAGDSERVVALYGSTDDRYW